MFASPSRAKQAVILFKGMNLVYSALQVLGLPEGSIRSFVLENDPVPRALLSVDPTFTALKNSRPGAALLRLRSWLLGPSVPLTPDRFLADNVGEVNLLRWTPDAGHRVSLSAIFRHLHVHHLLCRPFHRPTAVKPLQHGQPASQEIAGLLLPP